MSVRISNFEVNLPRFILFMIPMDKKKVKINKDVLSYM